MNPSWKFIWVILLLVTPSIACIHQISAMNLSGFESTEQNFEQFGPRVQSLLINVYNGNESRLQQDLETGVVDIMDSSIPKPVIDKWSQAPYNESIAVETYPRATMYELDLNNNETIPTYPNSRSPTSYAEFRHAIAHLVNKTRIIDEILKGYGLELSTPVMPWMSDWFNQNADQHPYDPVEAATILNDAGFVEGSTLNPNYSSSKPGSAQFMRVYPAGHQKAGQNLDPLIFYVRHDDPKRNAMGNMIRDELLSMGIPVTIPGPIKIQMIENKVRDLYDYHLYTGAWMLSGGVPDYLYYLYHSQNYDPTYRSTNYNNVHDAELDYWLELLISATSKDVAETACLEAQRRLSEIVGIVPLWCPVEAKAYRKTSDRAPAGWTGLVNQNDYGIDSWWTFLNVHKNDSEQGGEINYGVSTYIGKLNPIDIGWAAEGQILTEVYDSLLNRNPYSLSLMPNLAKSFEVGTWFNRECGGNRTKFTFHLREGVYWHDGAPFTSEDVKFTIDYLMQFKSWSILPLKPSASYSVQNVRFVETPDPYTVIVYMDVDSYWTIYSIGGLLIIPKHIWRNVSMQDALGALPDPKLVGTGPFKFVAWHVEEDRLLLKANNDYFMYCPVQAIINVNSRRVLPQSVLHFNVTVRNCFSDKSVNTTVTVYFDKILQENITLSLDPLTQIDLDPFTIYNLKMGLHEIRVEHTPEPYLNRTCITSRRVWCTLMEDMDLDFKVDGKEIALVAKAFATYLGYSRWISIADINHDDKIDGKDVALIARKFGWIG